MRRPLGLLLLVCTCTQLRAETPEHIRKFLKVIGSESATEAEKNAALTELEEYKLREAEYERFKNGEKSIWSAPKFRSTHSGGPQSFDEFVNEFQLQFEHALKNTPYVVGAALAVGLFFGLFFGVLMAPTGKKVPIEELEAMLAEFEKESTMTNGVPEAKKDR